MSRPVTPDRSNSLPGTSDNRPQAKPTPGAMRAAEALAMYIAAALRVSPTDEQRQVLAEIIDRETACPKLAEGCREALRVMGFPDPAMEGKLGKQLRAAIAAHEKGAGT